MSMIFTERLSNSRRKRYTSAMSPPSDRDLILAARRGQVEAYGELVRGHQTDVFNVCHRILRERREAEDMTQETFLRAYDRLQTFDPERPFGPWIRRVAANVCLNHLETYRATAELDEERDADQGERPEATVERHERSHRIHAAVAALPARYRVVIELRHFQELSYDEISSELGIPLSDVKSHLFRARKLLAEKLDAPDG